MTKEGLELKVSVKIPKYRIKVFAVVVAFMLIGSRWGIVSDAMGARVSNALMAWVQRGLKTHVV